MNAEWFVEMLLRAESAERGAGNVAGAEALDRLADVIQAEIDKEKTRKGIDR